MKQHSSKPRPVPPGRESAAKSEPEPKGLVDATKGVILLLTAALVAGVGYWVWGLKHVPEQPIPIQPAGTNVAQASTNSTAPTSRFQKLEGKWVRPDGGYVLQIRSVDEQGQMDAAYFNPNPIHVSRAIWMQGPGGFQIVVELNDVGYQGATYVLSHDPKTDRLVGQYNQPAMQQTFDIEFIRQPSQ